MPSTHTSITRKRGGVMRLSSLPSQRYSVLRVLLMTPLPLNQKGYSSNTVQTSLRSFSARRAASRSCPASPSSAASVVRLSTRENTMLPSVSTPSSDREPSPRHTSSAALPTFWRYSTVCPSGKASSASTGTVYSSVSAPCQQKPFTRPEFVRQAFSPLSASMR